MTNGTAHDLKVEIPAGTVQQLRNIAPAVGVSPNKPVSVVTKALRLLDFARYGNVTISTPGGTYEVNLKKL